MKKPARQNIYIYDHPESKIRFLEQTLAGKDWRATLVYPDGTAEEKEQIAFAKTSFEQRGYQVRERINEHNHHVLEIHHLGEGTKPSELIQEMGLAKGIGHLITHPSIPLEATLGAGKRGLDSLIKTARDPAHLNGIIYIAAEAFLTAPDLKIFGKKAAPKAAPSFAAPKNGLRKFGFAFFFAQSATYLFAAKNNDATSFDEFKNKINRTFKHGGDLTDLHYDEQKDKPADGIGHNIVRLLRRYPIEAGALFNNLGMVLYIAGTLKDRNVYKGIMNSSASSKAAREAANEYLKKGTGFLGLKNAGGFYSDMRGALTSIVAWTLMLIHPKKKDEETGQATNQNIFARSWDAIRENPQVGTGFLTLASSYQRLQGAKVRERIEPGSARNQIRGENVYILGDIMLMFTKNDHYGKKTGNVDKLADTLADFINKMPLILGPEHQDKMVKNMSNFLLEKGLAEIKYRPKTAAFTAEELKERADLLTLEVGRRVRNSYGEQLEQLGDVTARLIAQFPEAERPALVEKLSQTFAQLPWVYAKPEELKPVLEKSLKHIPVSALSPQPATEKSLRQAIGDIIATMDDIDVGGSVAALYDAVQPFMEKAAASPKVNPPQPVNSVSKITREQSTLAANSLRALQA